MKILAGFLFASVLAFSGSAFASEPAAHRVAAETHEVGHPGLEHGRGGRGGRGGEHHDGRRPHDRHEGARRDGNRDGRHDGNRDGRRDPRRAR
jgi:hypothetical protein